MSTTANIGLHLTPASDTEKYFLDWRNELCGDTEDSNMMKIDAAIGAINNRVAWSATEPTGQSTGDTWNQIL